MEDIQLYEEIIRLQKARIPAVFATIVESSGSCPRKTGAKMIVRQDGTILGTVGGGKTEAEVIESAFDAIRQGAPRTLSFSLTEEHGSVCGGKFKVFLEPITVPPHLVVIGGGHVGQAVSRTARDAGFSVSIVDPEELAFDPTGKDMPQKNPGGIAKLFAEIGVDQQSYLFIASRDHQKDFAIVREALATSACYIGMIGSKRKRAALEKTLTEEGFAAKDIGRVVSPAGLEIGAETPEEIAVSIVAQLIQQRRSLHGTARCGDIACRRPLEEDGTLQAVATLGR